jgi:hypothetical protein
MLSFCGIDVSKARLDVIVLPEEQCYSVSNDRTGWADLVERLNVAGKKPKVTIVAVMRKMITTLNAIVRDDVLWADRHSGRHSVTTTR